MLSDPWEQLLPDFADAGPVLIILMASFAFIINYIILDNGIVQPLLFRGGLEFVTSADGQSVQSIFSPVTKFGRSVVVLVSRPLIGETVDLIKRTVSSQDWKNAFVYTSVSTSTHFHLYGSVTVSESAFYQQFSDKLRESNPSLQKVLTKAIPALRNLSFSNKFSNDSIELIQSQIRPLFQSQIHRIGSPNVPGFSFHNLPKQDQIEILSFSAVLAEMQSGVEMSLWAAGEISKIVAERLLQTNSKSELNQQAVLLFDRLVEFGKDKLEPTAADLIFAASNPLLPIKEGGADLGSSLLFPRNSDDVKLFDALKTESLEYSKKVVESIISMKANINGDLREMVEKLKKKKSFCLENEGLFSAAQLLSGNLASVSMDFGSLKTKISSYPEDAPVELLVADYLHYLSTFDLTRVSPEKREEFQILEASFALYLNKCTPNQRMKAFPMFFLPPNPTLDEIRSRVEQRFGQMKMDLAMCNKRYGTYGSAQILETLLIGMPVPNFIEKIEDGLLGKLSSGFGFFGGNGSAKPSHPKDFSRILVVVIGGLTFAEAKQIKNLEGKFNVDIQVVTNTVFTPKTMTHHLS